MEKTDMATGDSVNGHDNHEMTHQQNAARVEKEARARLTEIHKEERRQLEDSLAEFRASILRTRRENFELEMEAAIEAAVQSATKRAGSGDLMIQYRAKIEGMLGHGTIDKMRREAMPGELPSLVIATAPKAGERSPKAPVLLVLDISGKLGWEED